MVCPHTRLRGRVDIHIYFTIFAYELLYVTLLNKGILAFYNYVLIYKYNDIPKHYYGELLYGSGVASYPFINGNLEKKIKIQICLLGWFKPPKHCDMILISVVKLSSSLFLIYIMRRDYDSKPQRSFFGFFYELHCSSMNYMSFPLYRYELLHPTLQIIFPLGI